MTHTLRLRDHLYRFHTGAFWRGPESVWHPSLIGVKVVFQTRFCLKKSSSWGSCKLWYGLQLIWKKSSLICGNGLLSLSNMHNKAIKKTLHFHDFTICTVFKQQAHHEFTILNKHGQNHCNRQLLVAYTAKQFLKVFFVSNSLKKKK